MKLKTMDLLNIPSEKYDAMLNSMATVTPGRGITDEEDIQFRAQSKAMKNALIKTSKNRFVSPEMKPVVQMFEKANYDLTKLPMEVQGQFADTYQKIQSVVAKNPSKYKNTPAELYCTIYEMFASNNLSKMYKRVKSSSLFNEVEVSREALKGIENWEYYASSRLAQSEEWIGSGISATVSGIATTVGSVNLMLHTLNTILIFLISALVVLCIISATFNIRLAQIVEKLANGEKIKKVGPKKAKEESVEEAVVGLNESTSVMTKTFLYKPVASVGKVVNNLSTKMYAAFDKTLTNIENKKKSKEGFDPEQSTEVDAVFITVIVVCVLPLVLPLLRSMLYYISHLRLKMSEFFKEQAEWTEIHIEELIAKRDNPSTSPIEKERLTKVIDKQKDWVARLTGWGEKLYKSQDEAGSEARSEIRIDDSKDYEQQVINEKRANKTLSDNPEETIPDDNWNKLPDPNQKEMPKNNEPKKPIVLF